jgi:hypothetical protein
MHQINHILKNLALGTMAVVATIGPRSNISGAINISNENFEDVDNNSIQGTFQNSKIGHISSASGTITLINSSVDEVDNFGGEIILE